MSESANSSIRETLLRQCLAADPQPWSPREYAASNGVDRESLYSEIAKANNFAPDAVPKIKRIFAKSWMDQARPGWWIQEPPGNWRKK